MAVKAAREADVSPDEFRALEEKVYRTIELLKSAREGKAAAEREAARLRKELGSRGDDSPALRREVIDLRRERDEVRIRVERIVKQIDQLIAQAAGAD